MDPALAAAAERKRKRKKEGFQWCASTVTFVFCALGCF